ncbi:MarR family winged helix-turn-helix transcriptional regulator [Anaerocolumna jejuensis]|uniref:MarR family winged helix-turn-helix transcriptional regulator n=1 Tax=Anaerocolumna jejuensis TaxID=259063 RepID=UPI003F7C878F
MNLLTIARYNGIFNRQTQAYIGAAFSSMNISYSEGILLMNLYDNEGINQEELSSMLHIDKAAIARSIKSLEKKGYIIREVKTKDRRVKKLFLTDNAKGQKENFSSLIQKWEDFITEGMETETLTQFSKVIKLMAQKSEIADFDEFFK